MAEEKKTLKKAARYISRYLQLRIVRKAAYSREVDGQRVATPGTAIQFDNGVFETKDPEEVAFIEARPEFGNHIQKVPDNVEDLNSEHSEKFKNLEEKENDLAEREAAVAAKEAALTDGELGKAGGDDGDEGEGDGLEKLDKPGLLKIVKKEKVEGTTDRTTMPKLIEAIRAARADTAAFND